MVIPEDFDFQMTQKQMLTLTVPNETGELLPNVPIGIYDGPIDRGGALLSSGATDHQGKLTFELSTPSSFNKFAYTP